MLATAAVDRFDRKGPCAVVELPRELLPRSTREPGMYPERYPPGRIDLSGPRLLCMVPLPPLGRGLVRFFTFHYMTYQGIDIPRVMGDTGIARQRRV